MAGAVLAAVASGVAGLLLWFQLTHVRVVGAQVYASAVSIAPVVDARLVELLVREGQHVEEGEVLGRVDDRELRAALEAADAARTVKASEYARAQLESRRAEALATAEIAGTRARLAVAEARVQAAHAAVQARSARLDGEIAEAQARYREAAARLADIEKGVSKEVLLAAKARCDAAQAMLDLYRLELVQSQKLVSEGIDSEHLLAVRKASVLTQEKVLEEAELNLADLRAGATPEAREAAQQFQAQRSAQLSLARLGTNDVESLRTELAVREAEVLDARARVQQAEARQTAVLLAQEQVRAAEAEMGIAEADVRRMQASLHSCRFISPVAGIVTRTFYSVGEVCHKGVACILVADDSKPRWVAGYVRERDAMRVSAGQRVRLRAPAGTGRYVDAVVDWVGLQTQSMEPDFSDSGGAATLPPRPERVWVRLQPLEPLPDNPVTGTRAQAVIRLGRVEALTGRR